MRNWISSVAGTLLLLTAISLAGTPPPSGSTTTAVFTEQSQNEEALTTVIAVLRPRGFEPSKITVRHGTLALLVLNRAATVDDPDVIIDDDRGQPTLRAKASQRGSEIWQTFKVSHGRKYKVRLSNHSTAVLDIEVQQ